MDEMLKRYRFVKTDKNLGCSFVLDCHFWQLERCKDVYITDYDTFNHSDLKESEELLLFNLKTKIRTYISIEYLNCIDGMNLLISDICKQKTM